MNKFEHSDSNKRYHTLDYFYRKNIINGFFCDNKKIEFSNVKINYGYLEKKDSNYQKANVIYYLNNGTNEAFFVDYCNDSITNVIPPDPIREGYKFVGWYK